MWNADDEFEALGKQWAAHIHRMSAPFLVNKCSLSTYYKPGTLLCARVPAGKRGYSSGKAAGEKELASRYRLCYRVKSPQMKNKPG